MSTVPTGRPGPSTAFRRAAIDPAMALGYLRRLERNWTVGSLALIAGGVPASFLGPFLAAGMFWVFQASRRDARAPLPPFLLPFAVACVVVIPLMYAVAWGSRRSLFRTFDEEVEDEDPSLVGAVTGAQDPTIILRVVLFAPRMVLHGLWRLRARHKLGNVDLPRAAGALSVLAAFDEGVPPGRLLKTGEPGDALGPLFDFLLLHDLIGISSTGDRVWLHGHIRQKFVPGQAR